jgi:hypothetical protein
MLVKLKIVHASTAIIVSVLAGTPPPPALTGSKLTVRGHVFMYLQKLN